MSSGLHRPTSELERRALAAWLGEESLESEDAPLPGGVAPGFAERVMSAESSVLPVPMLVPIDGERTPNLDETTGLPRASGARRRWGMFAGIAALAAGLGGLWIAQGPRATIREELDTKIGAVTLLERSEPAPMARPAAPIPDDLDEQIEGYIRGYGSHFGPTFEFHGAVLVARDGKVHYAKGFGIADPTREIPTTPTTRFRIGMLTEQFTAAAILQLRDAGMLQLDDPVAEHLPDYPNGRRITIAQLLQHESGIPNYTDLPNFHEWKLRPHTTEQLVGRFSELKLEFKPGEEFGPTNSGYFLLGAIIERKTGMSYGQYMQRYVFEPLGMTHTMVGDDYASQGPEGIQARGNVWNSEEQLEPPDPIDMSVFGAAGGIVSSVEDLAKWDAALYDGTLIARSSVEQMFDSGRFGYGFGWVMSQDQDQPVASFPGAIDGFNSAIVRYTEDRTLVVVLCNTEIVPAGRVAADIAMMAYGGLPPPRIEYPEVQVAPGTLSRYVGTYGITDDTIRVLGAGVDESQFEPLQTVYVGQLGERLFFDVPGHGRTWMHPMGRHRFFFKDNSGNYINFALDHDGHPEGLVVHYPDAELELQRKGD